MSNFTLMAFRAMSANPDISGNAMQIQGISDMVEEYLGVNRDIFRKEFVKTNAIRDGALRMWQKRQRAVAQQYMADDTESNYEKLTEVDMYYIDLYDLYHDKFNIGSFEKHINNLLFVQDEFNHHFHIKDIILDHLDSAKHAFWKDEEDYHMNYDMSDASPEDLYNCDKYM